jgi:hypothetical protein
MPTFMKPIPLVCGGGTSMIGGFIDVFREEFEKVNFPIEVSEIRMAGDPLKAVARGCMNAAIEETRAMDEPQVTIAPAALARSAVSGTAKPEEITKRRIASLQAPRPAAGRDAPSRVEAAPARPAPAPVAAVPKPAVTVSRITLPSVAPPAAPARPEPAKVVPAAKPAAKPAPKPAPKPVAQVEDLVEVTDIEELEEIKPEEAGGGDDIPLIS